MVTSTSHQLNTPEHLIIIELIEETQETTHMPQHAMPQEISHSMENIKLNLSLISVIYGGKEFFSFQCILFSKCFWPNGLICSSLSHKAKYKFTPTWELGAWGVQNKIAALYLTEIRHLMLTKLMCLLMCYSSVVANALRRENREPCLCCALVGEPAQAAEEPGPSSCNWVQCKHLK